MYGEGSLYIGKNKRLVIHIKYKRLNRKNIKTSFALELESCENCNQIVLVYEECTLSEFPLKNQNRMYGEVSLH